MDCPPSADNAFGPTVHGCRNNFDFTLSFEQSILSIAPSAVLLLLVPLRATQLRQQGVKTLRNGSQWLKQIAILALAGTQLALIGLWASSPVLRTAVSIPAAVLSFLASAALFVLSSMEHSRSIRPSSIINTYILFSLLLDLPQTRTLWLRDGPKSLAGVFTAGVAAKACILYLEALSKKRYLLPPYRLYAPESLVSLYNRVVLWWLNPLFMQGYKGFLSFERLYRIDADLASHFVEENFRRRWASWRTAKGKRPLFWALMISLKNTLVALILPRLCLSAFKLSQPLLINRITSLLSHQQTNEQSENYENGLIGATVLIYLGLAISNAMYKRQLHRFLTKLRGSLISAIHTQALLFPSDKLSDNAALTLVSADVNRICVSLQRMEDLFATPIEIGVAIFLLERQIGVSCVAPVALAIVISTISFFNSNKAVPMQKAWLAAVQTRVSYIASVLGCPKGFKMLGLTPYLTSQIQSLRVKELAEYAHYRKYVVYRNCFSHIPMAFGPSVTLMMFTLIHGGGALDPATAFTTLSLVALLTTPIQELIHAVPMFQTALASLDRVQAFLMGGGDDGDTAPAVESDSSFETHVAEGDDAILLQSRSAATAPQQNLDQGILRVDNGEVRLGKEKKLVLHDINIAIRQGTLNLIVGPVGCGKSTLLKTLVGDVKLIAGQRTEENVSNGYAYCAQDPWLPNDTFQRIILGESDLDPAWYSTVVGACALNADINNLASGDETIVGTKGVSLSGGQRQRLALARALYSRKKTLFVDDALSGLDARTSQAVFSNIFGSEGLCKRYGLTVVLATHAVQYLSAADHIVAIGENGSVLEHGTFQDLNARDGYVYQLSIGSTETKAIEGEEIQEPAKSTSSPESDKLAIAEQDLARRTGDISVYKYYAKSIGWRYGSIILLTGIAFGFGETFPSLWVRWWSEAEINGSPQRPLGLWIGIYIMFAILSVTAVFTHIWVMLVQTVPKSSAQLHKQLLNAVMKAPYSFFVNTDSGVTLNRFSNDMNLIETELAGSVMQALDGFTICVGSAALIAAGAKYVGLAMPFLVLVLYGIQRFYLRTSRQLRFMDLESQAPLLTHCSESISGVTTIRAFGWQTQRHKKCLELLDNSQRPYYLLLCIQRWLNLVLDLMTAAIALIVVAMALSIRSTSSAGSVGLALLQILSFNWQLSFLITYWTLLETSLGAVARCKNFETSTASEDLPSENGAAPDKWPDAGTLALCDVSASYNAEGENVLKNISISISAGEKIGICGRTGSGKSSLLLTILRLLDNNAGTITLDDVNLATIPRQTIRERLTTLPQEALTFPGSLRDNIDPLHTNTDDEITSALQKTGLLDIIHERGSLNTNMSDLSLSQGQMQLFAVARALLRKSKLFIVDEVSSSLDAITEDMILALIKDEFANSTVIAIAHRLKTIIDFDRIVVLDKGVIVESGPPKELLEKEDGVFRAMWERSGR